MTPNLDFVVTIDRHSGTECRTAYSTYIAEMIVPDMDSNPKKFWSFIKSKRNDKTGVAPIKDEDGFTYSEPAAKAEILNRQ